MTSLVKSSVNRSRTTLRVRSGSPYSSCGALPLALLLDVLPAGLEPLDVAGQLVLAGALGGGAHDDAGGVGDDLLEQRLEPVALGVGQLAGDAAGGAVGHVDQEAAGQADLAGQAGALVADRVLGDLHQDRLAGGEHRLDLARLAVLVAERRPVDLAGVEDRVAALADVDERRLHGGQHVLHAAEVDVADQRGLRLAGDVVLDEDLVLEHADLGELLALADHHDPLDGLAAGEELGLADDRGAAAAGLAALAAALLLGLEPGRAGDRGDLVLGVARLADPGDGVLRVVAAVGTVVAAAAPAAPAARGALALVVVGVPGCPGGPAVLLAVRLRRRTACPRWSASVRRLAGGLGPAGAGLASPPCGRRPGGSPARRRSRRRAVAGLAAAAATAPAATASAALAVAARWCRCPSSVVGVVGSSCRRSRARRPAPRRRLGGRLLVGGLGGLGRGLVGLRHGGRGRAPAAAPRRGGDRRRGGRVGGGSPVGSAPGRSPARRPARSPRSLVAARRVRGGRGRGGDLAGAPARRLGDHGGLEEHGRAAGRVLGGGGRGLRGGRVGRDGGASAPASASASGGLRVRGGDLLGRGLAGGGALRAGARLVGLLRPPGRRRGRPRPGPPRPGGRRRAAPRGGRLLRRGLARGGLLRGGLLGRGPLGGGLLGRRGGRVTRLGGRRSVAWRRWGSIRRPGCSRASALLGPAHGVRRAVRRRRPEASEPATQSLRVAATLLRCASPGARLVACRGRRSSALRSLSPTARPRRGLATTCLHCADPRSGTARTSSGRVPARAVEPAPGARSSNHRLSSTTASIAHRRPVLRYAGGPAADRRSRRSPRRADPARGGSAAGPGPRRGRPPLASPVSTSSGRTAGTACRSTRSSREPSPVRRGGQRDDRRPAVELAQALLRHPLRPAPTRWRGRSRPPRRPRRAGATTSTQPVAGLRAGRPGSRPGDSTTSTTSRPSGSASSSAACTPAGSTTSASPISRYSASLAEPVGRRPGVRDARVRVEARGVRHRHPGPEDRPLEGAAEVAVAGEAEPAALGVADPQSLDGRGLLLGLLTHRARLRRPRRDRGSRAASARFIAGEG